MPGAVKAYIQGTNSSGEKQDIGMQGDALKIINQEVDVASIQEGDSGAIGAAAGDITVTNLDIFDEMQFDITWDTGTDAVTITTSKDGENFSPVARVPWDLGAGTINGGGTPTGSLTANGDWRMDLNCKAVKFSKAGTTSTVTINWSAKNTGRSKF